MNRFELMEDESIVIVNPKHWRNYIVPATAMLLALAAIAARLRHPGTSIINHLLGEAAIPLETVVVVSYAEAGMLLLLVVALGFAMVETAHTRYYVTTKRIIAESGWLSVRISEMLLDRCETVSMTQRVPERIFNSGDILCVSAGASIYLDDVYDARKFRQTIMKMMVKEED
jgi:hypothetical protein